MREPPPAEAGGEEPFLTKKKSFINQKKMEPKKHKKNNTRTEAQRGNRNAAKKDGVPRIAVNLSLASDVFTKLIDFAARENISKSAAANEILKHFLFPK